MELVLDFETTGLDLKTSRICQIGFMFVQSEKVIGEGSVYCNPGLTVMTTSISKAFEVNGLTFDFLKQFNTEEEVLKEFCFLIKEFAPKTIIGQNIYAYDLPLLSERLKFYNIEPPFTKNFDDVITIQDTKSMAFKKLKGEKEAGKIANFKLQTLCKYFKIKQKNAHDALDDVKVTYKVYKKLLTL